MKRQLFALIAAVSMVAVACGSGTETSTPTTAAEVTEELTTTSEAPAPTDESMDEESTDESTSTTVVDDTVDDTVGTGSSSKSGRLGSSVLARTLERSEEVSSARFEGRLTIVGAPGSELPGELNMVFSGGYDLVNESSEMTIDMSELFSAAMEAEGSDLEGFEFFGDMFSDPIRVITVGDTAWVNWSLISMFSGADGDVWIETTADDSGDVTADFGFGSGVSGPNEFLQMLEDANADVEEVGRETIRGVDTTHIRALVDIEELSNNLPADERADLEEQLGSTDLTEFPMDFWIDDDGLLRRYALDLSSPEMLGESAGEITSASMVFEIYDYGEDLGIVPPPADQIVTEDNLGLFGN